MAISLSDKKLSLLCNNAQSGEIRNQLKHRSQKCALSNTYDRAALCGVMICTSLYGVNEASLRGYNNIMIASLWNCITLTLRSIVLYDGLDVGCMDRLLSNRDTCGFKSVMESNNAALSMTSTSSALLAARQRLLDSRTEGEAAPVGQVVFTQHSATRVYGCLSSCLLDVANITRMGDHTCSR